MSRATSRIAYAFVLIAAVAGLGARVSTAAAEGSWSFLFDASSAGNDSQYYLSLAVSNAGYPRTVIEPLVPRLAVVESDLPVVLFLARRCDCPPDRIVALRHQGLSWTIIFRRVGVPMDVLFVGMDRDPGPPYGHAWGYWKKHGRRVVFDDRDVVSLVDLQTARAVTGHPVYDIARARASGRSMAWYVAESGHRHGSGGRGGNAGEDHRESRTDGSDHGRGHGRGHGGRK